MQATKKSEQKQVVFTHITEIHLHCTLFLEKYFVSTQVELVNNTRGVKTRPDLPCICGLIP